MSNRELKTLVRRFLREIRHVPFRAVDCNQDAKGNAMSDILSKLRAFYENAETDECLYDIRRAIQELERLYALPLFDGPPTWQEEVAAVEDAFERSGVRPTWPDDEPGNIGPMADAMSDEIARLRLTDAEREAIETAMNAYGSDNANPECAAIEATLCGLLDRTK